MECLSGCINNVTSAYVHKMIAMSTDEYKAVAIHNIKNFNYHRKACTDENEDHTEYSRLVS